MLRLLAPLGAVLLLVSSVAMAAEVPTPERAQALLFDAAKLGRADLVPALVAAGADVNARDARGFTALILAAYNDQPAVLDALIAAKADPCLPDRDQGNTAQMGVAFRGHDALAARLLKAGCDVNARNKAGQTALMMAALFGRTAQIDMLIAAGADPRAADASGRTAASVAADQGNAAVAAKLTK
ncbi:ankyrin repeat domain-containing protein [Glacieibacterium frigidum]|uniref:Ankyrin repeat domain-containing protein n=1 Tax=Glacieibacterium frigidum TaxID=2593303 RepID=A0A552U8K1_9SPHN|nr:ankyrin repeat domain-containing protein [Glacieibacterium frigidum]TRW14545.1 ankyrin repeat domain-containing protein [Glacieibacterium frigidum]